METILLIVHLCVSGGLIALVLLQQGKGSEAGASFGSGASQTIFGSQGAATFLSRTTAVFVALFFLSNLALGYAMTRGSHRSVKSIEQLTQEYGQEIPAAP